MCFAGWIRGAVQQTRNTRVHDRFSLKSELDLPRFFVFILFCSVFGTRGLISGLENQNTRSILRSIKIVDRTHDHRPHSS